MCVGGDVASLKKGWLCCWWLGCPLAPNCDVYSHRQCLIQLDFITHSWGWFTSPSLCASCDAGLILELVCNDLLSFIISWYIYILVKKFNDLCWCWWCCRCRWLLVSLTAPTKPGAWASRCHLDVYILVLQQEIWIGNVEILFLQLRASRRHLDVYIVVLQQEIWIGNVEDSFVDSSGAQSSRCPPFAHFRIWSCL